MKCKIQDYIMSFAMHFKFGNCPTLYKCLIGTVEKQ